MTFNILAINPGSTSTKISVAHNNELLFVEDIKHSRDELAHYETIFNQYEFRKQHILKELEKRNIPLDFHAVVGRGGLAKPLESGVYAVNQQMVDDQRTALHQHPCDLGCKLAYEIASLIPGCKSYIADPGVVDELAPEARISGLPEVPRVCIWHALNQKQSQEDMLPIGIPPTTNSILSSVISAEVSPLQPTNTEKPSMPTMLWTEKDHFRQKEQALCP